MKTHELLREVFQNSNVKQIADEMGLSVSMVYKWAEPSTETGSGTANPLDRIAVLVRSTNDPKIAQWICEHAGGFFVKNHPGNRPHPYSVIPATNEIVQEFADMLSVIATAALDNSISKKEAQNIRGRWEELKSVTEGFVRCCEEGDFAPLKNQPAISKFFPERSV